MCPNGKSSELLVARGQHGGAKRSIGAVVLAEGVHPDGRPLHVSLQASESTERPGRYMARVIVPRPISSVTMLADQAAAGAAGTAANRWAAGGRRSCSRRHPAARPLLSGYCWPARW